MDAIARKADNGSAVAPASVEKCPLLAKGSHANREHCTATGFVIRKNEEACRAHHCSSPWRICWACAGEIPTPSAAYATVTDKGMGLCAYHEKYGAGAIKPRERSPEILRRLAPAIRTSTDPVAMAKEILRPSIAPAASKTPTPSAPVLPAVAVKAPIQQEKVHDGEIIEPDDPRLSQLKKIHEKYSSQAATQIDLSLIIPDPDQPRSYFNPVTMLALTESIRAMGQTDPGLVVPLEDGRYRLVDGERRYRACVSVQTGFYRAWVCEPAEAGLLYAISLQRNYNREGQTPMEIARALRRMKDEFGYNQTSIAKIIGQKISYVTYYMRFNSLIPSVAELMSEERPEAERLTASSAARISILPTEDQLTVALMVIKLGLNSDKVTHLVRDYAARRGIALRTKQTNPGDKWKVLWNRLEKVEDTLAIYESAHPDEYANVLRTRHHSELAELRERLEAICGAVKKLLEAMPK